MTLPHAAYHAVLAVDTDGPPTSAEALLDMLAAARPAWHAHANCHGHTQAMYPVADVGRSRDTLTALRLCDGCVVRRECAQQAERDQERAGVWGGALRDPSRTTNTRARKKATTG